jgi:2,3-bisphosphoglycerate-dependent phosphoglycerate mutase
MTELFDGKGGQVTRLYLMRHAQTADISRFHGAESDIGLSDWGHEQSRLVCKRFSGLPISAVYSSAMRRAVDTALPIAVELGIKPKQVKDLHERKMGELAGASRQDFRHIYTDAMSAWSAGDLDYTHESGESFRMMQKRGIPALVQILNQHFDESIIVVSHGMLIRVLLASLVPAIPLTNLNDIKIDNVAVNELLWDGTSLNVISLYDLSEELQNPPEDKPFW